MPRLRLCVEVPHGLTVCTLRELLEMMRVHVIPEELSFPKASGELTDDDRARMRTWAEALAHSEVPATR